MQNVELLSFCVDVDCFPTPWYHISPPSLASSVSPFFCHYHHVPLFQQCHNLIKVLFARFTTVIDCSHPTNWLLSQWNAEIVHRGRRVRCSPSRAAATKAATEGTPWVVLFHREFNGSRRICPGRSGRVRVGDRSCRRLRRRLVARVSWLLPRLSFCRAKVQEGAFVEEEDEMIVSFFDVPACLPPQPFVHMRPIVS